MSYLFQGDLVFKLLMSYVHFANFFEDTFLHAVNVADPQRVEEVKTCIFSAFFHAGDMTVSRNDLKKHDRDPEVGMKPNPCWHETDARTTDAAVEVLGLMWQELESKKNGKGGEEP